MSTSWVKQRWTKAEEKLLFDIVERQGTSDWISVANKFNSDISVRHEIRSPKQCMERYRRFYQINKTRLTLEEKDKIIELQKIYGNRWAIIAKYLPGRSSNQIKNFWHSRSERPKKQSKGKTREIREMREMREREMREIKERRKRKEREMYVEKNGLFLLIKAIDLKHGETIACDSDESWYMDESESIT
jgi:myb proto-oncogene protein